MDPEDDIDTHICLRCHTTIVGLEEYVKHKKEECPALNKTISITKTEAMTVCETSDNEILQPTNCPPTTTETTLLEPRDAGSPESELRQDAFLTMLELQCKNSPTKGTAPTSPRTAPLENGEVTAGLALVLSDLDRNDDNYELMLDSMSDHEENEDDLNPPKNHTGGKWKPGQGPRSNTSPGKQWLQSAGKADHDYDGSHRERMDDVITAKDLDKSKYCEACDKYLGTKVAYNKHFNSYSHLKKVNSKLNADKVDQIMYNCAVCQKNLSSKFAYMRHASSPLHLRKLKLSKGEKVNKTPNQNLRKSSRRICKNRLLDDQMWTLENDEDREDIADEDESSSAETSWMSCQPCKRTFQSKRNFAHHLLTSLHLKRAENQAERWELIFKHSDLLIKLSPFQCGICSYYFNTMECFLEHWKANIHNENVASMVGPFLCVECEHMCSSNEEMLEHLKGSEHTDLVSTLDRKHPIIVKEKRTDLFCKVCNLKLTTAFALRKHLESTPHQKLVNSSKEKETNQLNEKMLKCKTCKEEFADAESLQVHKLTHVEEKNDDERKVKAMRIVRTCSACDQVITTGILGEVSEHLCPKLREGAANSNESVKFSCSKCHYECSSSTHLLYHQALHEKPEVTPLSDANCKQTVTVEENMVENMEDIKPFKKKKGLRTVKKFKCTYCSKLYPKSALLAHLNTHTGEKPFKCNLCTLSFAQRGTLYMHLKRHTGVKQYKCDQCAFAAEKPSRLKRHKETHNTNRPRAHLCDVCGAGYHDRWSLKHHMKVHFGKDLKCPVENCPQAFRCPSELQMHMRVHNDERPFLCDKCGYRGRSQHQLTKHRRSHTGERPFKCPYCSYSAHLSPHLMRHMRIHTGAKPYKCPYCDYTCNTQENVRKHILKTKKHEGKKMYPCRFCDYSTNSAAEYKAHTLENHKDLVSTEDTDVISLLAGVYSRSDNIKTTDEPIPYVPRQERMKNNIGVEKPKKKKRTRKVEEPMPEQTVYTFQLSGSGLIDAEQILHCIGGGEGNGEQIYFPVEQEQVEEQTIEISPAEEEASESLTENLINSDAPNTIYIYVPSS